MFKITFQNFYSYYQLAQVVSIPNAQIDAEYFNALSIFDLCVSTFSATKEAKR
jgi:hypothetical protein